jgi:putative hydrolase of the HAD superfamily
MSSALLPDLFGTLVDYSPGRTAQGFPRTHAPVSPSLSCPDSLASLSFAFAALDRAADVDHGEFSLSMVPSSLFETVVLSVDIGGRKPHPDVYRPALTRLDPAPPDAVVVGDSDDADYAGPVAVGIPAYLIGPSGTSAVPASHRLTSIFELPSRWG